MAAPNPTPFIQSDTARQAFDESYKWFRSTYFPPFDEFERLARNKPSPRIAPELPKVTSGDLAAIIQEDPKRIIQQLATGLVTCHDYPEYAPIADVVLRSKLLPMYNRMGTALQKQWAMMSMAKTYGRAASYTFFTSTQGKLHTDYVIPYAKDILSEKGKVYAPDSNICFMRTWYQKRDLQAIITQEQRLTEQNKDYVSGWDLPALARFMNEGAAAKPAEVMTPAEKEKGDGNSGGYEVIHAFQQGKGAEQYAFAPRFGENGTNLRVKVNKDPRGALPIDFEYNNIDLSNPMGRSDVEIGGGLQNLIDQQLQTFMFTSTYMQQPALMVHGGVNKASLKIRPNAIWDMGTNPNNKVERDAVDNVFINNFVPNIQFLQSKLYALLGSSDNSISSDVGGVNQSKTPQGVKANQQRLGVADNYAEKQHEAWLRAQTETSLNIFFAEMSGNEVIDIGKQDVKSLIGTPAEKFLDRKQEKLTIPYSKISDTSFKFIADAGSSKSQEDADQLERMKEINDEYNANPLVNGWILGQDGKKLNAGELMRQRFERMGIKNLDLILTDMSPEESQAAKQAPFPIVDKPQIRINTADLTAEQISAALQAGGVNLPQQPGMQPPTNMPAGLSPQATADFIVEMIKAQAAAAPKDSPQGMTPEEQQFKQTESDQKQQQIDQKTAELELKQHQMQADTILKADKQAHDTQLAVAGHIQSGLQAEKSHQLAVESQKQAAKQAAKKPLAGAKA